MWPMGLLLNLWIRDLPFRLDTLKDVHRIVQNSFMATCYEKSGYDHVRLTESSRTYFGIQFGGYLMVYNTLPFGWKASPFIYQTVGMCVTTYLRKLSVQNTLYIDDRFVVSKGSDKRGEELALMEARKLVYVMVELLTRLGYTLSLSKCSLVPSTCKRCLGFLVDSVRQACILPEGKNKSLFS
jgi:hypothetical protein